MSDYVNQFSILSDFNEKAISSFVILSDIEKRIKEKIEKIGIPLKDWDIQINYGIKTGFNEAFIIDGATKDKLIAKSSKNAEIIRPILRGRDIKRYGHEFADLWLICIHNGTSTTPPINIEDYPDIKKHLDKFYPQLLKRQDKGITPYNLRSCIYMDDFSKQKIIYPGLMRIAKSNIGNFPRFCLDDTDNFFFGNDCYFIVGEHLEYLYLILNSSLTGYLFRYYIYSFDETGFKIFTDFFQNIPIPIPNETLQSEAKMYSNKIKDLKSINEWVYGIYNLSKNEIAEVENYIDKLNLERS